MYINGAELYGSLENKDHIHQHQEVSIFLEDDAFTMKICVTCYSTVYCEGD